MPANHELTLTRLIDAPRAKLFRCFREPELLKQWFAPKPYTVPIAELDFRVGGASRIVMRSPDGQDIPCPGTYLEIIPSQAGIHGRLPGRLGTLRQAVHDGDHDVRR
jgi:uncharacterized protein YndB with AHSA1/START domain